MDFRDVFDSRVAAVTDTARGLYQPLVPVRTTDPEPHNLVLTEYLQRIYILGVLAKKESERRGNCYHLSASTLPTKQVARTEWKISKQWHLLVTNGFRHMVRCTYPELTDFSEFVVRKGFVIVGVKEKEGEKECF